MDFRKAQKKQGFHLLFLSSERIATTLRSWQLILSLDNLCSFRFIP